MNDAIQLRSILTNPETYRKTSTFRDLLVNNDGDTIKLVLNQISSILKDTKSDPMLQLSAVRFSKDCIETFNDTFITQFQQLILPSMEQIALFDFHNDNANRGMKYFGDDPYLEKVGNSLLRLTLECIWVWAKWFPIDPDSLKVSCFRISFQKLVALNVKFHNLVYFDVKYIQRYLPDCMVPMKVLAELRQAVKVDLQQTFGAGSPSKIIQQRLSLLLQQEMARDDREDVFYSDVFRRMYRLAVRNAKIEADIRKDVQTGIEVQAPVVGPKKINQDQQVVYLNQQIHQLQQDLLNSIQDKQGLQNQLRNQNDIIHQQQQRIQVLDERVEQFETKIDKSRATPRYVQTSSNIVVSYH